MPFEQAFSCFAGAALGQAQGPAGAEVDQVGEPLGAGLARPCARAGDAAAELIDPGRLDGIGVFVQVSELRRRALAGIIGISPASRAADAGNWVGSWTASPQPDWGPDFPVPLGLPANLWKQTIRQNARLSIGGSQVRIVLSNEYGNAPLTIGAAHIALAGEGGKIKEGTDHARDFRGKSVDRHTARRPGGQRSRRHGGCAARPGFGQPLLPGSHPDDDDALGWSSRRLTSRQETRSPTSTSRRTPNRRKEYS